MRKLLLAALAVLPLAMCEVTVEPIDPEAFIYNARFANEVDNDGDGYPSEFDLEFDADIESGYSADIYVELYGKLSSETSYTLIATSETITITGNASTYYSFALTGGSHGYHDFLLELYDADTDELLDSYGPADDTDLNDHLEETTAEDVPASIYDATFTTQIDYDGDGYPSEFDLSFDPDVTNGGTMTLYVELYGRVTGSTTWNYITTTSDMVVVGDGSVWYDIALSGGSHGAHDFQLELYNAANDELLDTYGPIDDSDLSGHLEETSAED